MSKKETQTIKLTVRITKSTDDLINLFLQIHHPNMSKNQWISYWIEKGLDEENAEEILDHGTIHIQDLLLDPVRADKIAAAAHAYENAQNGLDVNGEPYKK